MRARRVVTGLALAAGSALGAVLLRRRAARGGDRAELYFADGSLMTVTQRSPEAEALLRPARELLSAARAA